MDIVTAAKHGNLEIVQECLKNGSAEINEALLKAIGFRRFEIVKCLVSAGATNLNRALLQAVTVGDLDIVKHLMETRKEKPIKIDNLLLEAAFRGYLSIVEYLCQFSIKDLPYVVKYAAIGGHLPIMKFFVENCNLDTNTLKIALNEAKNSELKNYLFDLIYSVD